MKQEYITLKKASKILGVTTQTLRNWDNEGKLKVIRTMGGHRRIAMEEVEKIIGAGMEENDSSK
jgi:putative resolvase